MHDCQKFREDFIDGTDRVITDCEECRSFCRDVDVILMATASATQPTPEFSEEYWNRLEDRLHLRLLQENSSRTYHSYWKWSGVAAAAAIAMVVTWTSMRPAPPAPPAPPQIEVVDDHIQGLDPTVVTYLERSELFLRNYTKIQPSDVEDIDDARVRAKQSLMEIGEQKELAGNFTPVQITLDEYENVLREIKNSRSNEELADIKTRILANGLIANMKAYQPQFMLVSGR